MSTDIGTRGLAGLAYDNSYARLPDAFGSRLKSTPIGNPVLGSFNAEVAALIGLEPEAAEDPDFVDSVVGSRAIPGAEPLAQVYSGHQFGHYVPRLGDGRAILLGEVRGPDGRPWDLHLKGAGPTPYSRMGDGRAVLRSTIREYLGGEAMAGLGIPTTRGLCIVGSETPVRRERVETAAMLIRVAPSHVRFGTFEYFCYTDRGEELRTLCDYVVERHRPALAELDPAARGPALLRDVVVRSARLVAAWQAVGFCHGVLNTDNMSILGLTLDYGPFGFLDAFNAGHICNHSDHHGRYAFDRQPEIVLWNLGRLALAMRGPVANRIRRGDSDPGALVTKDEAYEALDAFGPAYIEAFTGLMRDKLGLREPVTADDDLLNDLIPLLDMARPDYTRFWRLLADLRAGGEADAPLFEVPAGLLETFASGYRGRFVAWAERYAARLRAEGREPAERRAAMRAANPKFVLRNYLAEQAIRRAEQGDFSETDRLLELLRRPFDEQPEHEAYAAEPPEWGRHLEISCSS